MSFLLNIVFAVAITFNTSALEKNPSFIIWSRATVQSGLSGVRISKIDTANCFPGHTIPHLNSIKIIQKSTFINPLQAIEKDKSNDFQRRKAAETCILITSFFALKRPPALIYIQRPSILSYLNQAQFTKFQNYQNSSNPNFPKNTDSYFLKSIFINTPQRRTVSHQNQASGFSTNSFIQDPRSSIFQDIFEINSRFRALLGLVALGKSREDGIGLLGGHGTFFTWRSFLGSGKTLTASMFIVRKEHSLKD